MKIDPTKCLICDSEMKRIGKSTDVKCINDCMSYLIDYETIRVELVYLRLDDGEKLDKYIYVIPREGSHLQQRIDYWKENDRYLIEILGRH